MVHLRFPEMLRALRSDERFDWKFPFKGLAFAVSHPFLSLRWLRYISEPLRVALWQAEPRLIDKALRPYLNARWTPRQRVDALTSHYTWLEERFSQATLDAFYGTNHPVLARWTLRSTGQRFSLRLGYNGSFEREGDLTLSLCQELGQSASLTGGESLAVVGLTFGVARVAGLRTLCIGCVQARNDPGTREMFATLTRGQFGLRPKSLLVDLARLLALRWNMGLVGIDPRAHPFTSLRYQLSRNKRKLNDTLRAGYLSLWNEAGASAPIADGWYPIAVVRPERSESSIPSHKRSMYAKRKAWLRDVEQQIYRALQILEK